MKELGFAYATRSGISIGIDDMLIPGDKSKLVESAEKEVVKVQQQYPDGAITHGERFNKIISLWGDVTERVADEMFKALLHKLVTGLGLWLCYDSLHPAPTEPAGIARRNSDYLSDSELGTSRS